MTLKQKNFVKKYLENGGNGTQAALAVYDTDDTNVAHSIASENLRKPAVQREINEALEAAGLDLEHVSELLKRATIAGLGQKATNADTLRGIDMMLKVTGAYPDKTNRQFSYSYNIKQNFENMSYSELVEANRKLDEKIKELLVDD